MDRYSTILELLSQKNVRIIKYEDMVLDFRTWLDDVLDVAQVRSAAVWRLRLLHQYRNEFCARPEANSHKRNVLPGDHVNKLRPQTIQELNRQFQSILKPLGYPCEVQTPAKRVA